MTFCANMDAVQAGASKQARFTEPCGAPGVGKTQIGMQLAVSVQLLNEFMERRRMHIRGYRGEFYVRPLRRYGERHEEIFGEADARDGLFRS